MVFEILFWLSLAAVFYTFAGYPVLLRCLNSLRTRPVRGGDEEESFPKEWPALSVILVVWNEESRIGSRIRNLEACRYDGEREIIIVCDGCTDGTVEKIESIQSSVPLKVVEKPEQEGKASGINAGVGTAQGEILIFADARQRFDGEALECLVKPMIAEPRVAGVSGSLEIEKSEEGAGAGMDAYWRFEKWIRNEESRLDSVIGCTGAIYALRRDAFVGIPADTLIDDVVIPMQALVQGSTIQFEPTAIAFDPQTLDPVNENRRKIRTLAGNYQMLFRYLSWLNPFCNRCAWQLISHKYMRLAGPLFLGSCLAISGWLSLQSPFYAALFGLQIACYVLGLLGIARKEAKWRAITIPGGFLFLQWQSLKSLFYYFATLREGRGGVWKVG
jgi:cellulose synthase/poly-beta-1,6-N-acetylglucosamine synthase-like glycosyltransferase